MAITKIALHGVPRSGTSWLGAIFDSSENILYRNQPIFSYAFKSFLCEKSSKTEIDNFFNLIMESNDEYLLQVEAKESGKIPSFNKEKTSHIIYKETRYHNILENMMKRNDAIKVVGIIRNPKSVISSWYLAPKEFKRDEWDISVEWEEAFLKNNGNKEEFYGFKKWKEASMLFLYLKNKYPDRFYLVEYKDLLNKSEETVKRIFDFCDINFSNQTKNFIELSQKKDLSHDAYAVYRAKQVDDKWREVLPLKIIESINKDLKD